GGRPVLVRRAAVPAGGRPVLVRRAVVPADGRPAQDVVLRAVPAGGLTGGRPGPAGCVALAPAASAWRIAATPESPSVQLQRPIANSFALCLIPCSAGACCARPFIPVPVGPISDKTMTIEPECCPLVARI